ncbi:MAG: enolase C-terminal domain-like protein [Candidatus Sulfopaludibacter sp.]|nr:enolase C-terminal domain-like protein [Candidatus Sulfopaludibacter sp.]
MGRQIGDIACGDRPEFPFGRRARWRCWISSGRAPVYRVLGGPTRHKVRVFADSAAGAFSAVGITLPQPASRNQGKAFQNQVQALSKQLPDDRNFVLSAQGSLTPGDAASVAQSVQSSHPLWFDEPCAVSNREVLRKISDETVTPLGFGRGIGDSGAFLELLGEGLVDVVRPDIARCRISGARRIAVIAEADYGAIAPHHDGGPVATAAALHLAASVRNFFIQHMPLPDDPLDREMRAAAVPGGLETPRDARVRLCLRTPAAATGPGQVTLASFERVQSGFKVTGMKVFDVSLNRTSGRPYVFVKIETNQSLVGWGRGHA